MTFHCNAAVVRGIPESFANALRMEEPDEAINVVKARQQHSAYVDILKRYLSSVHELHPDEAVPDCMFVEDTSVFVGSTVVITQLGHVKRRPEAEAVKQTYLSLGVSAVVDMKDEDPDALADGGDVLFTGQELFVGISTRTNDKGYAVLKKVFASIPVHAVPVVEGLHLKSVVTCAAAGVLVVADNRPGKEAAAAILAKASGKYRTVFVPDAAASNVLNVAGHLLVPRGFPASKAILETLVGADVGVTELIEVDNSEGAKADGALTCCSVLFSL